MANVFSMSNERVRDVNRNTFDLSFKYSGTFKFGPLYPVFCKEVLSGDSWKIDPVFGFEFMPMVFPVQTRINAHLHFFYVRRRNLWRDYKDYFGARKENLDPPYLDFATNFDNLAKTGSLGDYFGLPTTLFGDFGQSLIEVTNRTFMGTLYQDNNSVSTTPSSTYFSSLSTMRILLQNSASVFTKGISADYVNNVDNGCNLSAVYYECENFSTFPLALSSVKSGCRFRFDFTRNDEQLDFNHVGRNFIFGIVFNGNTGDEQMFAFTTSVGSNRPEDSSTYSISTDGKTMTVDYIISSESFEKYFSASDKLNFSIYMVQPNGAPFGGSTWSNPYNDLIYQTVGHRPNFALKISCLPYSATVIRDIDADTSPYWSSTSANKEKQLKISAEPFRAYESVYNCFYRDARNNPLIIDGQPEYNKWIPTDSGGPDTTPYSLRYRNWEQDFLTTAVQSPQQGVAPLVGITTRGDVRFMDQETGNVYTAKANVGEDGQTIESYTVMTPTMPEGNLLALGDMVSSGISINDFRNVNALQIWLETNMRKGQTFKDLIKGHFNVDVRFDELDMPEFIGGVSRRVNVYSVTQTSSDVLGSPLGSYAGQASLAGASGDAITHFCDEPGYIIGILSFVPVPTYSQLLPKHFIKRNVLDHFSPEFGHIGFVPIKYNEVCPVQAFNDNPDSLNDTFGYQRAWYDYLASTDEVHGLFRNQLRNYLMTRQFDVKPVLSESFLLVDPKQLNEVFASTTENDDKILGQIVYDVSVKRPIPRYGVPRLE